MLSVASYSQIKTTNICDPLLQLKTFYQNMILYKPQPNNNIKLIKYNLSFFYHNTELYKNYMNLPYNKYTYTKYGWNYYNGKPQWNYIGKYPRFNIKF
jgi:hypothetical protein